MSLKQLVSFKDTKYEPDCKGLEKPIRIEETQRGKIHGCDGGKSYDTGDMCSCEGADQRSVEASG